MPKDEIYKEMQKAWRIYLESLEKSLTLLEGRIREAREMAGICKSEWCAATEHVIDDLSNSLFSISEPRDSSRSDSRRIKELRRQVHDLYADCRLVYSSV